MPAAMPVAEVVAAANSCGADGLLVFDSAGVTGHCDHVATTAAGVLGAGMVNLPVLGWTLPEPVAAQLNHELGASFIGHQDKDIDLQVAVDRVRQTSGQPHARESGIAQRCLVAPTGAPRGHREPSLAASVPGARVAS